MSAKQTKAQAIAERLRKHEHILSVRVLGRRLTVVFPRERGGRMTYDVIAAERLAERLGL